MLCRGIRGATTAARNTKEAIVDATRELLLKMVEGNAVEVDDIASIWFTSTHDLNATFPASVMHDMDWPQLPVMCAHEMHVNNSLPHCIRILMLVNTNKKREDIVHIYLGDAVNLEHTRYGSQTDELKL